LTSSSDSQAGKVVLGEVLNPPLGIQGGRGLREVRNLLIILAVPA